MDIDNRTRAIPISRFDYAGKTADPFPPAEAVKLAEFLELSDMQFISIIRQIEAHPLWHGFFQGQNEDDLCVARKNYHDVRLAPDFFRYNKSLDASGSFHGDVDVLMKSIGYERFLYFFISNESHLSSEQIAVNCGLSIDQVISLQRYLDHAYVPDNVIGRIEFERSISRSALDQENGIIYTYSPAFARGIYAVNYRQFNLFIASLQQSEKTSIRHFLRFIEMINLRMNILYMLTRHLMQYQKIFCKTGLNDDRVPLSQADSARILHLDKSVVSRAVQGRRMHLAGKTRNFRDFFPGRKEIILGYLNQIIREEHRIATDEILRKKLYSRFRISVSRRTISAYRKQMMIPSSFKRTKK